jgi:hypothetical protein
MDGVLDLNLSSTEMRGMDGVLDLNLSPTEMRGLDGDPDVEMLEQQRGLDGDPDVEMQEQQRGLDGDPDGEHPRKELTNEERYGAYFALEVIKRRDGGFQTKDKLLIASMLNTSIRTIEKDLVNSSGPD